jgi:hypothetical protein
MSKWNDIIVFIGYALLIVIPPVVFWFILMQYYVMVNLLDMFTGFMRFLSSL